MAVECGTCGGHLCSFDEVFLYEQSTAAGQWHLIVRPTCQRFVQRRLYFYVNPKVYDRHICPYEFGCNSCEADLGNQAKVGPNMESLLCFAFDKVRLSSCPTMRWSDARWRVRGIEERTGATLFFEPPIYEGWNGGKAASSDRVQAVHPSTDSAEECHPDIWRFLSALLCLFFLMILLTPLVSKLH